THDVRREPLLLLHVLLRAPIPGTWELVRAAIDDRDRRNPATARGINSTGRFFCAPTNPDPEPTMHDHAATTAHGNETADLPDFIEQDYSRYDAESHEVWRILFERRMATLRDTASHVYLEGAERIGLEPDRVPDLADVNRRLAARTGWAAVGVQGFIPAAQFFRCLSRRRFPTTLFVRPRAQLDYLPEPDIFHDVFGHVPLHSDPVFADFLQQFGALAADA